MCKVKYYLLSILFFLATSCENSSEKIEQEKKWMESDGKVKVLCTTEMIADLVEAIGGDHIDTLTLIQGQSDPHSYQLVKGDDEKFAHADIIFYNGLGLEHGASLAYVLEKNPRTHNVGAYIQSKRPDDIIFVEKTVDPHVWMDIDLWKESVHYITEVLSEKMPQYMMQFEGAKRKLDEQLSMLDAEILARMVSIPEKYRYLVSTHDAFNYFGKAYLATKEEKRADSWQKRVDAPEGLAPESQLSTYDIQRLVEHLISYSISVIFTEANVGRDSIVKITDAARKKGHFVEIATKPLFADSLGPEGSGAETYQSMLRYDAKTIHDALYGWYVLAESVEEGQEKI